MLRVAAGFIVGVALTAIVFILWARVPSSPLLVAILPPTNTPTPTSTPTPTATLTPTATFTHTPTSEPSITPSPTVDNARPSGLRNPVPIKEVFYLQRGTSQHYTIEILSTDRGSFAEAEIKSASGFVPTHATGTDILLITVRLHYQDGPEGKPLGISKYDFASISDSQVMPDIPEDGPTPLNGNILPGAYSVGTLTELAFTDDPNPLIGFAMGKTADGSAGFFFATK